MDEMRSSAATTATTATLSGPVRGAEALAVLDALEARGAELAGVLNAAAAGLVAVIADALVTEVWQGHGINSPEHWVSLRFGLGPHRARRYVAAARALAVLPACRAAYVAGEISEDHVAALVAAQVPPHNDGQAADLARAATVSQLRTGLRGLPPPPDTDTDTDAAGGGGDAETAAGRAPFLARSWGDDGCLDLRGVLDGVDGAVIDKALDAATDKLWRIRYGPDPDPARRQHVTAVDALRYLAELGLDAMDPATAQHLDRMPSPRYVVNIHLDANPDTHTDNGEWRAAIHLGPALPAWAIDEICCDGHVRLWIDGLDGGNVNLGFTRRTADPKLRTVIEHRDSGCRIPGCAATRGLRIHHILAWPAGGPTDTHNLLALCPHHHRLVHKGHYRITGNADDHLTFTDDRGRPIAATAPVPPAKPPPAAATDLGLPPPTWHNRTGEPATWHCMTWNPPPPTNPNAN